MDGVARLATGLFSSRHVPHGWQVHAEWELGGLINLTVFNPDGDTVGQIKVPADRDSTGTNRPALMFVDSQRRWRNDAHSLDEAFDKIVEDHAGLRKKVKKATDKGH